MTTTLTRRSFVQRGTIAAAAAVACGSVAWPARSSVAGEFTGRITKAVKLQMVQSDQSLADKFRMLKELGFDGVEVRRADNQSPDELVAASQASGLPIHGVINSSNPDLRGAIDLSAKLGGNSVLYVAGRVSADKSYDVNYRETQAILRDAAPYAEQKQVRVLVENVWNNFLLSPLEMARYLDEVGSPWVGCYFDVGNVVAFGYPEQWIRILGSRIGKLDIKEYSRTRQRNEGSYKGFDVPIGAGDVDWASVRSALRSIGYRGWATAEVRGGDRSRMAEIAQQMDHVLDLA